MQPNAPLYAASFFGEVTALGESASKRDGRKRPLATVARPRHVFAVQSPCKLPTIADDVASLVKILPDEI